MFVEIQEQKLPWKLIKDKLGTIYKDIYLEAISEAALRRITNMIRSFFWSEIQVARMQTRSPTK